MKAFASCVLFCAIWLINGAIAADHPLLNDPDLPGEIDKRNLLLNRCSNYITEEYRYKDFFPLSSINDISPSGYIVRLPIYVQGTRDALIQFSTRRNPAPNASVYEILLGGEGNSKLKIRRKRGYEELLTLDYSDAIAEDQPTKFVIEITNDGTIRVFSELDKGTPIAEVRDPQTPMRVKYLSFAIYEPAKAEFFYNCQ